MPTKTQATRYDKVIERWKDIPYDYLETDLESNLVNLIWQTLGLSFQQVKRNCNLGAGVGLIPDFLIYQDPNQPPVLVVETKARKAIFANAPEQGFADFCKQKPLYRQAVGYEDVTGNGIKQYLDKDRIPAHLLASYGLVFNGDFFQLWRRVDGLVFPVTPIQKVTEDNIPQLIQQLEYCLHNPNRALVSAIWNQKGGVAKTTNTINLGAALALQGKKVLLVDLDAQTDLTRGVGLNPEDYSGYLNQCVDKLQLNDFDAASNTLNKAIQAIKFPTSDNRTYSLSILPGERKSIDAFKDKHELSETDKIRLLGKLLNLLKEEYDYIFVDVSPSLDILTQSVLLCCDTVLTPVDYSRKSLHHAVRIYQTLVPFVREQRAKKEPLLTGPWNLGLVFSNCPLDTNARLEQCIQKELEAKNFSGKQCKTRLKSYAQTKLAEFYHRPVISWQKSPITQLYTELAREVFLTHNFADN